MLPFQSIIKIWNYLEFLHKDITKASVPYLKITSTQNVAVLLCLFGLKMKFPGYWGSPSSLFREPNVPARRTCWYFIIWSLADLLSSSKAKCEPHQLPLVLENLLPSFGLTVCHSAHGSCIHSRIKASVVSVVLLDMLFYTWHCSAHLYSLLEFYCFCSYLVLLLKLRYWDVVHKHFKSIVIH